MDDRHLPSSDDEPFDLDDPSGSFPNGEEAEVFVATSKPHPSANATQQQQQQPQVTRVRGASVWVGQQAGGAPPPPAADEPTSAFATNKQQQQHSSAALSSSRAKVSSSGTGASLGAASSGVYSSSSTVSPQIHHTHQHQQQHHHQRRSREIFELEQALLYQNTMQRAQVGGVLVADGHSNHYPTSSYYETQLTYGEQLHLNGLVHSFLTMNGLHRTLESIPSSSSSSFSPPFAGSGGSLDVGNLIGETARKTSLLFDNEQLWPLERFSGIAGSSATKEVPLVVMDATTQAVGGTIELLLEKVVLEERDTPVGITGGKPNINFTNVFLLTAPLFVVPDAFLTLCFKLFKSVSMLIPSIGEVRVAVLQNRVLTVLHGYAAMNAADFTKVTIERLISFAVTVPMFAANKKHPLHADVIKGFAALVSTTKAMVVRGGSVRADTARMVGGDAADASMPPAKISSYLGQLHVPQPHKSLPPPTMSGTTPILSLLDMDDTELCRQMCLLSFSLFQQIHLRDLLSNAWTDSSCGMKLLAGNLHALLTYSARTQQFISSQILSCADVQQRRTAYTKAIRLARSLFDHQNFEMATAVLEGLRDPAITRLKGMLSGVEAAAREQLEGLSRVLDPFNHTVSAETSYLITSSCIPTIAPMMSAFFRAEEAGKSLLVVPASMLGGAVPLTASPSPSSGAVVVNWSKMILLAKPMIRWISFQAVPYPFQVLPNAQWFLWEMPGLLLTDAARMDASLECEP